eukprot:8388186-Alexandrium_andersonii.AAC.1
MSASLVGSEMCIRDRPWSSSPAPGAPGKPSASSGSSEPSSPSSAPPASCLLYTSDAADDM